ncbi:oxygen-insensitive NADPH nitroreductase [Pseudohongiella sp. SYSU M77423]|uniref:oxygen-insensitive NADPH nitroreductase n=1 Tax=Pseudohongiella sp. SYSU M77423 TaxID=3042312 RepID=UPI0024818B5A|nr:oxygen-insensitive NADPH nitroreductase [Pseudohongiella sp. SYSU M77423]MDH7944797.1 oxygen-insensitive NADPH nitroreductase [Pseudohongiella sp. SYSU M77423]
MNATMELLQAHRSIRKFKDQPLADGLLEQIITAGQCAATSSFLQGATIIRVTSQESRQALAAYAGNQPYVAAAAEFLVFCADLRRAGKCCEKYQKPFSGEYTEQFIIATVDAALFAQNVVVAAESEGLGICYIGGLRNNPRQVSDLLKLPRGVYPVFGLCLGYPDQDPETKPRLPLPVILKQDTYDDSEDAALIEDYDEAVREYYRNRTGGGHGICWSEQVSTLLSEKSRPHMRGFLAEQGFDFK